MQTHLQFVEQPLECVGPLDGTRCPHAFRVDLGSVDAPRTHTSTLIMIVPSTRRAPTGATNCLWSRSRGKTAWMAAISVIPSLHDALSPPCLHFRCGPRRKSGRSVPYAQHKYCHNS